MSSIGYWGAGMVICLERDADLHMAQLMPLPLTVSCFSGDRLVLPFWYRLTWAVAEKGPLNGCLCVCVCVCVWWFLRADCEVWRSRNNSRSSNSGQVFSYPATRCQDECLASPLCVAVDVGENICVVHTDPVDLTDAYTDTSSTGFTQYIVDRECYRHLQTAELVGTTTDPIKNLDESWVFPWSKLCGAFTD